MPRATTRRSMRRSTRRSTRRSMRRSMRRSTQRSLKKRMIGGVHYYNFLYEFKVGFSLLVEYENTNATVDVDDEMVTNNADKLVEIFTKRVEKAIELGNIRNVRNIKFKYIKDTDFQLHCELDVDEIENSLQFVTDNIFEVSRINEFDRHIPDLPALDVGRNNNNNEEHENADYAAKLINNIDISEINEFDVEPLARGRNLAALRTGFTKGAKANPEHGSGLANLPPNVLQRVGSFLSGKKGTLNEQRLSLRSNGGYNNEPKPVGGAGAAGPGGRRRRVKKTRRRMNQI
jgi:hypothetical protein